MLLSPDGTTLLRVTNGNLKNGECEIPDTVTHIANGAFSWCTSLTKVIIPNSVTHIGNDAFEYCTSLTEVTIPKSVTHIGEAAFLNCRSLTQVTIPNSVTHIGNLAFHYCSSLTQVTIPNSLIHIGNYAFLVCFNLKLIIIDNQNKADYQAILNLLPPEMHSLVRPWRYLKAINETKQTALVSVAALSMKGLTAHLLFKLLTQDGKIAGRPVSTQSFFNVSTTLDSLL